MTLQCRVSEWQALPVPGPTEHSIFAIGDVHGCAEHLALMHQAIGSTIRNDQKPATVIRLGDFIDRGLDSKRALTLAAEGLNMSSVVEHNLLANHEEFLLGILDPHTLTDQVAIDWIRNGGIQTLQSFGIDDLPQNIIALRHTVTDALGHELRQFLSSLEPMVRIGDLVFVHAGIDPRAAIENQAPDDLLWIRDGFLDHTGPFPDNVFVIHGHSICAAGIYNGNRLALDSGCFIGGGLTAAQINGDKFRLLCVTDAD